MVDVDIVIVFHFIMIMDCIMIGLPVLLAVGHYGSVRIPVLHPVTLLWPQIIGQPMTEIHHIHITLID